MHKLRLYIIRHGESDMNTQPHIVGGRSNQANLTDVGVEQARQAGRFLRSQGIVPSHVYVSPARRTRHTAEHALATAGVSLVPIIDDALQEMSQGDWENQLRAETYTDAIIQEITKTGKAFKAPGGESMIDVGERMRAWADDLAARHKTGTVLVFGHGLAIRCLASILHDWTHEKTRDEPLPNASVSLFVYEDGAWRLEYLGRETGVSA